MGIDSSTSWPPPDPDRMPRKKIEYSQDIFAKTSDHDYVQAFRERQRRDLERINESSQATMRQRQLHEGDPDNGGPVILVDNATASVDNSSGRGSGWRDSEGERLDDFGVDEEIDFYDADDIPLAELLRRRNLASTTATSL